MSSVFTHFPSYCAIVRWIIPGKHHLFTKWPSGYWHLRIYSDHFQHVILHEGHPCPKLQNPLLQKAKENLLPGEKGPVSGRMRDDEKGIFPEPYPASGIVPLSRRAQLILRMIDSATSPSAPRRMTRWEANYEDWRFSDLKNQSKGRGNLVLCL